jgi:tol-pal system protein YbgF
VVCLALAGAGCGPARPGARSPGGGSSDSAQLAESVARLRLERRQRERKIRDLENQLAARGEAPLSSSAPSSMSSAGEGDIPSLPVQVLSPTKRARGAAQDGEASTMRESSGLGRGSEAELPGELTVDGERVIGVADDGSEIVYVDDAATGKVVAPSPEVLAEMGRTQRRSASPTRLDGPELDEGNARDLIDDAAAERLPPFPAPAPAPLASLGRRAARRGAASASSASPSAAPALPAAGKLQVSRPTSPPLPSVRGGDGGAAEAHYQAAIALVRRAEYAEAITSLRAFLQRHPRHDYADNAQYWLGEAFYAQRQYDKALVELRRVVEVYPQGNKVPDALLKVGYCHLAMGDRDKSAAVLRDLIRLFPRSAPALLAEKKLEEVSQ